MRGEQHTLPARFLPFRPFRRFHEGRRLVRSLSQVGCAEDLDELLDALDGNGCATCAANGTPCTDCLNAAVRDEVCLG